MCGWHSASDFYVTAFHLCPVKEKCGGPKEMLKVPGGRTITNPVRHFAPTPIMSTARACYSGPSRKLVVALDIGTTFSGAAYAFLDPGQVPQIRSVTRQVLLRIPDPPTRGNERGADTSTIRILVPQKFPPYCITIATAISVALRTGLISRIAMDCSG
jgi:hypothetical protein